MKNLRRRSGIVTSVIRNIVEKFGLPRSGAIPVVSPLENSLNMASVQHFNPSGVPAGASVEESPRLLRVERG